MNNLIEEKLDNLAHSLGEIKTDVKELKTDLKPVFEHVHMVKGVIKAVGLGIGIGGLLVGVVKLILFHN